MTATRTVLVVLVVLVLGVGGWIVWALQAPDRYSRLPHWVQTRPSIYLKIAMARVERQRFTQTSVDWHAVEPDLEEMIAGAVSTSDTYAAIRDGLNRLGDPHNMLVPPPAPRTGPAGSYGLQVLFPDRVVAIVYPGSAADAAGIHAGDRIPLVEGHPPMVSRDVSARGNFIDIPPPSTTLTVRLPDNRTREVSLTVGGYRLLPAETKRLGDDLGYVAIPATAGAGDFASRVRDGIATADAPSVCGWILDVRRTNGGVFEPMLQAVQPLLGDPPFGSWIDADGRAVAWTYPSSGPFAIPASPKPLSHPHPFVAVLTSRLTTGAGEALAVAFKGRPGTRAFGEPTWGMAILSSMFTLPDGARLELTAALDADRVGHPYRDRVDPDEKLAVDWAQIGTPLDPVLVAAGQWLRAQPACHK